MRLCEKFSWNINNCLTSSYLTITSLHHLPQKMKKKSVLVKYEKLTVRQKESSYYEPWSSNPCIISCPMTIPIPPKFIDLSKLIRIFKIAGLYIILLNKGWSFAYWSLTITEERETVVQRRSVKKVLLKISQNSPVPESLFQ